MHVMVGPAISTRVGAAGPTLDYLNKIRFNYCDKPGCVFDRKLSFGDGCANTKFGDECEVRCATGYVRRSIRCVSRLEHSLA